MYFTSLVHPGKGLNNHHSKPHVDCLWDKTGFKCHSLQIFSKVVWTYIEGSLKRIPILFICLRLSTFISENRHENSSFNVGSCLSVVLRIMLG